MDNQSTQSAQSTSSNNAQTRSTPFYKKKSFWIATATGVAIGFSYKKGYLNLDIFKRVPTSE